MQNFGQILFVIWRESVEAMLVVGILHAWLAHQPHGRKGLVYLWLGVAVGLLAALALGLGIEALNGVFGDEGQDYFQAGLQLLAAALIVQMVLWMRQHGAGLRRDMETALGAQLGVQRWWGVSALAAIAVAREGSETVVFLGGLLAGQGWTNPMFWATLVLGFALAGLTFAALQWGGRHFSWRAFFRVTELLLLLLGGALLVSGVERLEGMQVIPALVAQLWDASAWLDDGTGVGGLLGAFAGYRARPSLMAVLVLALYWATMLWLGRRPRRLAAAA